VSVHRIPEGDNTNIEAVVGRIAVVANRCRIAIEIDHHVRKQQGHFGEVTVADARGATALVNKARTARVLNRMTPAQAQSAKVADHREYIRSDNGKANYVPPFAATWFKIGKKSLRGFYDAFFVMAAILGVNYFKWGVPITLLAVGAVAIFTYRPHTVPASPAQEDEDWINSLH